MSEILHNKSKQYGIPYCSTEHVMSMYWNVCLMMVTVTETCSKLYITEYIVVFWLNDILVSTTLRNSSYKKCTSFRLIYFFLTMLPNNSTVQKRTLRKACSVPDMKAGPDGNRAGLRNVRFRDVAEVGDSPRTLWWMCSLQRLRTLRHTKRRMAEWRMGDELKKTSKERGCDLTWHYKHSQHYAIF